MQRHQLPARSAFTTAIHIAQDNIFQFIGLICGCLFVCMECSMFAFKGLRGEIV